MAKDTLGNITSLAEILALGGILYLGYTLLEKSGILGDQGAKGSGTSGTPGGSLTPNQNGPGGLPSAQNPTGNSIYNYWWNSTYGSAAQYGTDLAAQIRSLFAGQKGYTGPTQTPAQAGLAPYNAQATAQAAAAGSGSWSATKPSYGSAQSPPTPKTQPQSVTTVVPSNMKPYNAQATAQAAAAGSGTWSATGSGKASATWIPTGTDLSQSVVPYSNGTPVNVGGMSTNKNVIAWNGGLIDTETGGYITGYGPKTTGPAYPGSPGAQLAQPTQNAVQQANAAAQAQVVYTNPTHTAISTKPMGSNTIPITIAEASKLGLV